MLAILEARSKDIPTVTSRHAPSMLKWGTRRRFPSRAISLNSRLKVGFSSTRYSFRARNYLSSRCAERPSHPRTMCRQCLYHRGGASSAMASGSERALGNSTIYRPSPCGPRQPVAGVTLHGVDLCELVKVASFLYTRTIILSHYDNLVATLSFADHPRLSRAQSIESDPSRSVHPPGLVVVV